MWFCAAILKVAERDGERRPDSLWEEQFFLVEVDDEKLPARKRKSWQLVVRLPIRTTRAN